MKQIFLNHKLRGMVRNQLKYLGNVKKFLKIIYFIAMSSSIYVPLTNKHIFINFKNV